MPDSYNGRRSASACERCRIKKLKCDGQLPHCTTCRAANLPCEPAAGPSQRGPKKGYLKSLQNKIATLEQQLAESQKHTNIQVPSAQGPHAPTQVLSTEEPLIDSSSTQVTQIQAIFNSHNDGSFPGLAPELDYSSVDQVALDDLFPTLASGDLSTLGQLFSPGWSPGVNLSSNYVDTTNQSHIPAAFQQTRSSQGKSGALRTSIGNSAPVVEPLVLSDLEQSDLNQIYFERAHPSIPIIHQRNYFAWTRLPSKSPTQSFLQHAMWAMAASLSANRQPLQKSLCRVTSKLMTACSEDLNAVVSLEFIQARLLMSIHYFVHHNSSLGWISAGECFRLVQLMRLHELDDSLQDESMHVTGDLDWIHLEEKRRVFWMSYCLDILICKRGRGDWPLTLHENVSGTRLPMPDEDFQDDESVKMQYLYEVYDGNTRPGRNPLVELILFCTISCNSALIKERQRSMTQNDIFLAQFNLIQKIDSTVTALEANYSVGQRRSHPLLHFTRMFAFALTLCLCGYMRDSVPTDTANWDDVRTLIIQRASEATSGFVSLARSITLLSFFKIHPFTPLPVGSCSVLLGRMWPEQTGEMGQQAQELLVLLQELSSINHIARDYLPESLK